MPQSRPSNQLTHPMQTPDSPPQPREPIAVAYVPQPGLLRIAIVNALLNIVTLSIYRFWAKTRVRRHIWNCIRINGEPLEYTGTGFEIFLGALIVFGVIGLPFLVVYFALVFSYGPEHWALAAFQFAAILLFLTLYGYAVYRARRYRLSRTLWRGIRGALVGSPWAYSMRWFAALLLKVVTLGWSTPAMNLMLENRIINEMRFGDQPFRFAGGAGPLYSRYAVCWCLTVFVLAPAIIVGLVLAAQAYFGGVDAAIETFSDTSRPTFLDHILFIVAAIVAFFVLYALLSAVVWATYLVREMNVFTGYTGFDQARFALAATTPSYIALWVGNFLIFVLTLGIGQPFVVQRTIRYFCDRLSVEGGVDIGAIRQSQERIDRRGEGLADAFDIDGI